MFFGVKIEVCFETIPNLLTCLFMFVMTLFRLKVHVPGEFIGIGVGALDATANSLRITVLLYVFFCFSNQYMINF